MREKSYQRLGMLTAGALLIVALYVPTFRWLAYEWWTNDYYSHGPLVVLVSLFLIWRRRAILKRSDIAGAFPLSAALGGLSLMVLGLLMHLAGLVNKAMYVSAFSLPILLAGLVGFLVGMLALRRLAFPLAFLWLAVPLPFVEAASFPLQVIAAGASTAMARLLGIPAEIQGAQVILPTCALQVGAPCSGLRSIVALLTLVVLFVYVIKGPWLAKLALLVLAGPIAIMANVVRVTLLLVIAHRWGREAGLRYFHDYSSPVLFIIAFLVLVLLSWIFRCREIRSDW